MSEREETLWFERTGEVDEKLQHITDILELARAKGYTEVDIDTEKPWGGYIRFIDQDATQFIDEFFPDMTIEEAHLGIHDAPLSPKILLVMPGQRLSLQTHERRAERWKFLTTGSYYHGHVDGEVVLHQAVAGDVVQFESGDLHRLCGTDDDIVLVAEVWQHIDSDQLSDEDDITRLEDDYAR